jgi:GNAT superfamily N-acetyltransferase
VTTIRPAATDELAAVLGVLDAAALATEAAALRAAIDAGDVLVAVDGGPIIGALVLDDAEVEGVAVRPGRRGQGIGRALVEAAAERRGRVEARFDADLRAFYATLGFAIEEAPAEDRLHGVCPAE